VRVTAIADLHGAVEHIDVVGRGCDALLVLGDLIDVVDHRSMDGFVDVGRRDYERVFAALPDHSFVTFGNADIPELLQATIPPQIRFLDGESVRLGGATFGFVGGGLRTPPAVPGDVDGEEYEAKFDSLGPVDVVCTHMPPRIPWYVYDTVARRFESGSVGLIAYVQRHQPRYALFGHVHQPLVNRGNIGRTEMVNVGHLQALGRGFTIEVDD
jgi:Icc-related predicted phosphoesterase